MAHLNISYLVTNSDAKKTQWHRVYISIFLLGSACLVGIINLLTTNLISVVKIYEMAGLCISTFYCFVILISSVNIETLK